MVGFSRGLGVYRLRRMEEITQSWKRLSLIEEEGRNLDLTQNKREGRFVLAAKFFTRRSVNIEAVAQTFRPLWCT